jgi:hypothetical protein
LEVHRLQEGRLHKFGSVGKCVVADMDEGQKQPEHSFG